MTHEEICIFEFIYLKNKKNENEKIKKIRISSMTILF